MSLHERIMKNLIIPIILLLFFSSVTFAEDSSQDCDFKIPINGAKYETSQKPFIFPFDADKYGEKCKIRITEDTKNIPFILLDLDNKDSNDHIFFVSNLYSFEKNSEFRYDVKNQTLFFNNEKIFSGIIFCESDSCMEYSINNGVYARNITFSFDKRFDIYSEYSFKGKNVCPLNIILYSWPEELIKTTIRSTEKTADGLIDMNIIKNIKKISDENVHSHTLIIKNDKISLTITRPFANWPNLDNNYYFRIRRADDKFIVSTCSNLEKENKKILEGINLFFEETGKKLYDLSRESLELSMPSRIDLELPKTVPVQLIVSNIEPLNFLNPSFRIKPEIKFSVKDESFFDKITAHFMSYGAVESKELDVSDEVEFNEFIDLNSNQIFFPIDVFNAEIKFDNADIQNGTIKPDFGNEKNLDGEIIFSSSKVDLRIYRSIDVKFAWFFLLIIYIVFYILAHTHIRNMRKSSFSPRNNLKNWALVSSFFISPIVIFITMGFPILVIIFDIIPILTAGFTLLLIWPVLIIYKCYKKYISFRS